MAKTIKLTYDGVDYTLEFTRRTVAEVEAAGFSLGLVGEKPATMIPLLFEGAFLAHHRMKNNRIVSEIFDKVQDKDGLLNRLLEMYTDPVATMFDEPEPSEKNASWEADF